MRRYWKLLPAFCLSLHIFGCTSKITYKHEILNSPVGMVAFNNTVSNYTELDFYAYNLEADFSGYRISVGNTKDLALANTYTGECLFSKNSNLNKPTKIQLGGAVAQTGFDCYVAALGPLAVNTWVSVRSFGSRDCSKSGADSGCSPYSDPASAEVQAYIAPPTNASIQHVTTPDSHYLVTLTLTVAPAKGLGLFYSPNKDEAESKASEDGSIFDGFCNLPLPTGPPMTIQIGGTPIGANCYISNFYLYTGDTLSIRTGDTRVKFPWSDFVSVTIP
jgi:hypothetical protein